MVAALARFGKWHNLGATHSSTSDVYPDTATFSFHGADYTSPYVAFQGKETASNVPQNGAYAPLDTLTPEQEALIRTYDAAPYVSSADAGSIPFIDFANQYLVVGASYDPQVLQGISMSEIAAQLENPKSDVAHAIGGTTNALTAAICGTTDQSRLRSARSLPFRRLPSESVADGSGGSGRPGSSSRPQSPGQVLCWPPAGWGFRST